MRNMPAGKKARLERQQAKRKVKEDRRLWRRAKPSPLEVEIERCNAIAGHSTTRAERDEIRAREMAEIVDFIARGRIESARMAAERKASSSG